MVRAFVTGGTGLVGSHIVRALLAEGYRVRVGIRPSSDCSAIAGLPIETVFADVLDRKMLKNAVAGCDLVFHAAANFSYSGHSPQELEATAVKGTANVLYAAAEAKTSRVVITSSSVVFGYSDAPIARDEQSKLRVERQAPYITSKVLQDQFALQKSRELGLDLVLTCPTMVVGPFAPSLGPSNAIITSYLNDPIRLTFPGGCNLVAAADVGAAHVLVSKVGAAGQHYLIGGDNLEWREIHAIISELCGTYGPLFTANHSACYLAASFEELRARIAMRPPQTTRTQATMVGRYYWYQTRKLAGLGFKAASAKDALARALSWLVASVHVSREARTRLRLSARVWTARRALCGREIELRKPE